MKRAATGRAGASRTPRQLRVAEEIRHVLAGIFARVAFRDPDLTDVAITVTEVRVSPDLKHATAFVARLGRSDVAALLPALKRAAPFIRSEMAKPLGKLRVVPDVTFQADTAIEYAQHVDRLLRQPEVERDLAKPTG